MIFLPVTRPWSLVPVVRALNESDAPRDIHLLLDAPGCWDWPLALKESGWSVALTVTGNPDPPVGRIERRARHLEMRRMSQKLTFNYGRVLYLEDDTLIPPDTWSRLSALLDDGYAAASGVQLGRHGQAYPGVWHYDHAAGIMDVFEPRGVVEADAVGHYCLMTTGEVYATTPIDPGPNEPIDCAHTRGMAPIAVDSAVRCGHLLENGDIVA